MNSLDQLKQHTVVVADTGDIDAIAQHKPQDATTNPSLLFKAAQMPQYNGLIDDAIAAASLPGNKRSALVDAIIDRLSVNFGCRILEIVPGRVSTEVDARLSFDMTATVDKAHQLIALYNEAGVDTNRVLIKIASTWEGIRAAEQLERNGIHCNLTLLFGFGQAVACAEAGVTLISPFVGRIYDWYKAKRKVDQIPVEDDPGVHSVTQIFNYFKKFGFKTEVMGASFRTKEQVMALCGSDLLTIAPTCWPNSARSQPKCRRNSTRCGRGSMSIDRIEMNESTFRWMLNEDAMATEKLAEGIRGFASDLNKLRDLLQTRLKHELVAAACSRWIRPSA